MRMAYRNLIDDATASSMTALSAESGYPVTNVQDQRLSTVWKSSTTTSQSVLVELPTFPLYPDSSAGTIYRSDFSAGVDSWTTLTATNMSIYATCGTLVLDATTTTIYNVLDQYRVVTWVTGSTCIIRYKTDDDLSSVTYYNGTSHTAFTTVDDDSGYTIATASMIRGSAYSNLAVRWSYASTAIAATKTVVISGIYVGTGAYTTTLENLSGNGNDATVVGAVPVETGNGKGFSFGGIKDYLKIAYGEVIGAYLNISLNLKSESSASDQDIMYSSTTVGRRLVMRRPAGTNSLQLFLYSGLSVTFSSFFTDALEHSVVLKVDYTSLTVAVSVSKDGSSFGSTSLVVPDVVSTTHEYMYIGISASLTLPSKITIADLRIYNRDLNASETLHLSNRESWLGEMDGLVGWWDVDYGLGVNTAAVLGHNLLPGTTLRIQGHDANDWGDPDIDEAITVNPETCLKFFTDTEWKKYWRFSFGSQGSLEIGRLWLGEYLTIDPSSLLNFKVTKKRSDMVTHGKNRQKWASIGTGWRMIDLTFPKTAEEMIYQLTEMYDEVGNHSSLIFCNFDTMRDFVLVEPLYCSIVGELGFTHNDRMGFDWSLTLEEEK